MNKVKINIKDLWVPDEKDWEPVRLTEANIAAATEMGKFQYQDSKERKLRDRSIFNSEKDKFDHQIWSKFSEFAICQYAGNIARVTNPGEHHDYADVGGVNARHVMDPEDGLIIHMGDQGVLPMVLTTTKDKTFSDKTIWIIGWQMTDFMRRDFYWRNQGRDNPTFGFMGNEFEPHEQLIYPRKYLIPIRYLSKEIINTMVCFK